MKARDFDMRFPSYMKDGVKIVKSKRICEGLYCALTENDEKFFLCAKSFADKSLSTHAKEVADREGTYYSYREEQLGILIFELSHTEVFLDYSAEYKLALLNRAYTGCTEYFAARGINIREDMFSK